ncbi:ribonuclease H-like domain-containing protein [Tanacetum coccineum]|uniref:Ribonuclease H-like domain-containing protein n=1 Tax=Tanacetum coccineum TaxID=301880 RepID=A0ABQ5IQU3_9ASTR
MMLQSLEDSVSDDEEEVKSIPKETGKMMYLLPIRKSQQTVNTGRQNVNTVRARGFNAVKPSACWVWKPIKPNGASLSNSQLNDKGFVDSGCSRHMSGNIAHLSDFKDFDRGYVTFGGGENGGRITGKGTIKTDKLDFDDVYFVKELKFNLFSVSQMCDKKNYVLFTDSECLVLSPNFKLPDENQILLKIPRQDNMYSFDMKNIVPKDGLTCLVAKATSEESMLWHRRLGHVNFKNINKLVKENLVRDLPLKRFENDQTCVACLKGKQHRASKKLNTGREEVSNATPGVEVNTATNGRIGVILFSQDWMETSTMKKDFLVSASMDEVSRVGRSSCIEEMTLSLDLQRRNYCEEFEKLMKDKFQMSSMGENLTIFWDYRHLFIDGVAADVDEHLYRSMIGCLMYLTASRPDIMFALLTLDSDYDGATQDRKSTTGGCQFLVAVDRRKARVVLSDDEVIKDDSSKQGRKLSEEEVQEKASTKTELFIQEVTLTEVIQASKNGSKECREKVKTRQGKSHYDRVLSTKEEVYEGA